MISLDKGSTLVLKNISLKRKKAHAGQIKGVTVALDPPIKKKNLDTFNCIKISNLIWQDTTLLIQSQYNRFIILFC